MGSICSFWSVILISLDRLSVRVGTPEAMACPNLAIIIARQLLCLDFLSCL
jgi:hypothetical protein